MTNKRSNIALVKLNVEMEHDQGRRVVKWNVWGFNITLTSINIYPHLDKHVAKYSANCGPKATASELTLKRTSLIEFKFTSTKQGVESALVV